MQFQVPQFIGREPKIIGPLTFKQSIFIGIAGALCFFLYFTVPFEIFLFLSIGLLGGGAAFAFLKIGGRSLPVVFKNFLMFKAKPKIYLWKKKDVPVIFRVGKKQEKTLKESLKEEENEEELPLKISERSGLRKTKLKVEAQIR